MFTRGVLVWAALAALLGACAADKGLSETAPHVCTTSGDCPEGQVCGPAAVCMLPPSDGDIVYCDTSDTCPSGQICKNHVCTANVTPDGDKQETDTETSDTIDADSETIEAEPEVVPGVLTVPSGVDFPPLATGESDTRELLITVTGEGPVTITALALGPHTSPDFTLPEPPVLPKTLAKGETLAVQIRYLQSNLGGDSGSVVIESDAQNGPETSVILGTKNVGQPSLSCEPASLDFGLTGINGEPTVIEITCTNVKRQSGDDNTLQITSLTLEPAPNPHFSLSSDTEGGVYLRSGRSAKIPVSFAPATSGDITATLRLFHNAPDLATPYEIPLAGRGGKRELTPNRSNVHFGQVRIGAQRTEQVLLSATGDLPVTILSIAPGAATGSVFSVDTHDLLSGGPKTLNPGEVASFDVLFAPTAVPQAEGAIEIRSDAGDAPVLSIPVDGNGTTFYVYTNPGSLDFAPLLVGSRASLDFSLINGGSQLVTFKSVRIEGPEGVFTLSALQTPFALPARASQALKMNFTPLAELSYTNALLVFEVDDSAGNRVDMPLSGVGALPHLRLVPESRDVDFIQGVIGQEKVQTYTLKNTGLVALTLGAPDFLDSAGDPGLSLKALFTGGLSVEPAGERTLTFTFAPAAATPTATLPRTATRTYGFTTSDLDNPSVEFALHGSIVAPVATLTPAPPRYDFGSVPLECSAEPIAVTLTNTGSGLLTINAMQLTSDSNAAYYLSGLPNFPIDVRPASESPENPDALHFFVHFNPTGTLTGTRTGTLRITNEGYTNRNLDVQLVGKGVTCGALELASTHLCGCRCVDNSSTEHCGSSCSPCTAPNHADPTCNYLYGTYYQCGFACKEHFKLENGACVPENTVICCGVECQNCTDPGVLTLPAGATAICDKTQGEGACSFTCAPGNHRSYDLCLPNDTADHCGLSDYDCNQLIDFSMNANATCVAGSCSYSCWTDYLNCDSRNDNGCEVNKLEDARHCGSCTTICPIAHNAPACVNGLCTSGTCAEGWADCTGGYADGCETNVATDMNNCGGCNNLCSIVNGAGSCMNGTCTVTSCTGFYRDCDKSAVTGCESNIATDLNNCGGCDKPCLRDNAESRCQASTCEVKACYSGYGNCDNVDANGCEVNLATNAAHCGICNWACTPAHGTGACVDRQCAISSCNTGYDDCNDLPGDGCETNLYTDVNNCGACYVPCTRPNANTTCIGGLCRMGNCLPGFANCNNQEGDGCEVNTTNDPANCNICGRACTAAANMEPSTCEGNQCVPGACKGGYANCDNDLSNGCETDLASNPYSCGGCGVLCAVAHGAGVCSANYCLVDHCYAGYDDCNDDDDDGCETAIGSDPLNCGSCNAKCVLPSVTTPLCVANECKIGRCQDGYMDCNHVALDGCEINTDADTQNCGSCGHVCRFNNGTGECRAGACTILTCNDGFGSIDGIDDNGCEGSLNDVANTCGDASALMQRSPGGNGDIRGDVGTDRTFEYTGWGNKWFRLRVIEYDSTFLDPHDLEVSVTLEVPPGVNYDLLLYKDSCAESAKVDESLLTGLGVDEGVCKKVNDDQGIGGHSDDFWVYVYVKFVGGSSGQPWKLYAAGNQNCTAK